MPDEAGLHDFCEERLASAVAASVERIHFHGLDIEMANLTVTQPSIDLLKVEVFNGLEVDRSANGQASDYTATETHILGVPTTYYVPNNDTRHVFDFMKNDHRPYLVAVTALIESPMKMYVQNQNFSQVLFGSQDDEHVKNVVRFEANIRASDLLDIFPINNKRSLNWKITDFNNIMNENPYF